MGSARPLGRAQDQDQGRQGRRSRRGRHRRIGGGGLHAHQSRYNAQDIHGEAANTRDL